MSEQPDLPPSFNPGSYRRPQPRDQEKDETKRMGIIVLGIVALLLVVVLARSFMVARAPSTATVDASGTPVITADNAPVKAAPATAGGLQVAGADQDVLGANGTGASNGQLAPGPEAPAPDKLATQAPAPVVTPPPIGGSDTTIGSAVDATPAPTANAPAATLAAPSVAPPAATPPAPVAAAVPAPTDVVPVRHHHHARAAEERVAGEATASGTREVGAQEVQFGALASLAAAHQEWRHLKVAMPELLRGHKPHIIKVDRGDHIFYRLRTGGFADHAAARKFCAAVKDQGRSCAVF